LSSDSALAHTTDLPPYLPELNPLDFSIWGVLQAKDKVTPHANLDALHVFIIMEWDWLAEAFIGKACHSFRRQQEAAMAKNGAFIE
jgi:hypothetical protein